MQIRLRAVEASDLDLFFEHQSDPRAVHMAAFTPPDPDDRDAFDARWRRIQADSRVTIRTIEADGQVAGSVASFPDFSVRDITYGIAPELWGRGIATEALRQFLAITTERPLFARAASDNAGSIRVLEKCGFVEIERERGFAHARGTEIEETVFRLDATA